MIMAMVVPERGGVVEVPERRAAAERPLKRAVTERAMAERGVTAAASGADPGDTIAIVPTR